MCDIMRVDFCYGGACIMAVIAYQGTVENGQVRLASDVRLPEKTKVYVIIPEADSSISPRKFVLSEMLAQMPADYQTQEEDWGEAVGKETW